MGLEANEWTINPLTSADVYRDSDEDSGIATGMVRSLPQNLSLIWLNMSLESMANFLAVDTIPSGMGTVSYGSDAINALRFEGELSEDEAIESLYDTFSSKSDQSLERMGLINQFDPDSFNRTLLGISDPTNDDSDMDGLPDGWEYCYSIFGHWLPCQKLN